VIFLYECLARLSSSTSEFPKCRPKWLITEPFTKEGDAICACTLFEKRLPVTAA
jgi:hypothetical protein